MTASLASLFSSVATKQLAAVDLPKVASHQHELNGSRRLRQFFGEETTKGALRWHYFSDDEEPSREIGTFTFYDSRLKSFERTGRTEWRMYYPGEFLSRAAVGDVLILARSHSGDVYGLVFQAGSSWLRAAKTLFDIEGDQKSFRISPSEDLSRHTIEFVSARILEELDLDIELPATTDFDGVAAIELDAALKAGRLFPAAARLSAVARSLVLVDESKADATLQQWLEAEELIFRAAERRLVDEKLRAGFRDVDDFIAYSLSVHNRRKSRMGLALQNHLSQLFAANGVRYTAQMYTENRKKPDFVFPGADAYRDKAFDASRLTMLAVKSSCKERWTQVLTEAARIPVKHLCTLEPAISEAQTDEMARQQVVLVMPAALHETFSPRQKRALITLADFIEMVRARQDN